MAFEKLKKAGDKRAEKGNRLLEELSKGKKG